MDDPKNVGDPDCYGGEFWIPVAGCVMWTPYRATNVVHSNSGVLNKWYYLMVEGSGQAISEGSGIG
jgi:Zn-dependent metalloprotease